MFNGVPVSTSADSPCFSGNAVYGDLIRDDVGGGWSVVFVLDPTKSPRRIAMYSRDLPVRRIWLGGEKPQKSGIRRLQI